MVEAGLLAGLELVVQLVLVLVHVLQEVRSQGRREWMRKIGVDHNSALRGRGGGGILLQCGRTHDRARGLYTRWGIATSTIFVVVERICIRTRICIGEC